MSENLKIYDSVRVVPEDAKKPINGGRLKGMTDINPMYRIKSLTEQFGPVGFGWYYDITEKRLEQGSNNEMSAFVQIDLFVKIGDEWSKPITGIGGSSFVTNEKNGLYVSDECFKMALTDAISVSCKALGIGADVYWKSDKTKYTDRTESEKPQNDLDREIAESDVILAVKICKTVPEIESLYKEKRSIFKNQSRLIEACAARKKEITYDNL